MALRISRDTTLDLIEQKFGSVDNLVVEWEERVRTGKIKNVRSRNRSTIYRWLDKGLPSGKDTVFGFCGVLDVDPISILDLERSGLLKNFGKVRRAFQLGLTSTSPFRALWEMFSPGPNWPSDSIANSYYGRSWHIEEFEHDASNVKNEYALLEMVLTDKVACYQPVAFHVAYRRKSARDKMWRPYGSVIRLAGVIRLISESGDFQERQNKCTNDRVRVETYFGPGAVEFRIVSLHEFDLSIVFPSEACNVVRFFA